MCDWCWCDPVIPNDHVLADIGDAEQFGREGKRQPDAAVRRRISGEHAAMKRSPGPGETLHPWHRRAAIHVGVMMTLLLENAEYASHSGIAPRSARHLRALDEAGSSIDVDGLIVQGNDEDQGLAIGGVRNRLLDRLFRGIALFISLSWGHRNCECNGRHTEPQGEDRCSSVGELSRFALFVPGHAAPRRSRDKKDLSSSPEAFEEYHETFK